MSAASPPRVSILIPCRNEAIHIEACLSSVRQQEEPEGGFEILVIDGASDDATPAIVERIAQQDSRIRIIHNAHRIVSPGLNSGIRAARGEIIVRMDAHTEYAPDYVRQCVAALTTTAADNVGGPARTRGVTRLERAICAAYHSPFAVGGARFHNVDYEGFVDTVTYGCWWKKSFERFGYFDEELVRNQDDEHNLRIIRGGGKIWQTPRIRSWYRPRGSLDALFRQYCQYGYWKVRVIQKHRLPASWRHLVPGTFVATVLTLPLVSLGLGSLGISWMPSLFSDFSLPDIVATPGRLLFVLWLGVLFAYALAVGMASIVTARRAGWDLLALLPATFACYHVGYGWGFLRGVLDFLILRHGPRADLTRLTRGPE